VDTAVGPLDADSDDDWTTTEIEEIGPGDDDPAVEAIGIDGLSGDALVVADDAGTSEEEAGDGAAVGATIASSPIDRAGVWFGKLVAVLRDPSWRHGKKESFRFSLIVTVAVGLAYWFTNWPLPSLLSSHPDLNFYLIQPLIWGVVAALALHGWYRLDGRPPVSRMLIGIALLVGLFHVAILAIAGVVWGFSDSPTAGRLINYPKNLLFISTLLAGLEVARAYLFHVWKQYGEQLAFALVSAIFFIVVMPAAQWAVWDDFDRISTFVAGRWVPALALSVLATFLVQYGGIGPSFAYRFALLGFTWFSPNLPDLDWPVLLLIGVLVPVAAASLIQSIYKNTTEGAERAEDPEKSGPGDRVSYLGRTRVEPKRRRWVGWAFTTGIALLIMLFFTGALGFRMVVVEGTLMEPAYERGDLTIVRENVDVALLRVDDVIVFDQAGRPVTHRIVTIQNTPDGLLFTTKGDNVERHDPPIREEQIEGKVVFRIPNVGHINLWLRGG
jgi:signal peptidase I